MMLTNEEAAARQELQPIVSTRQLREIRDTLAASIKIDGVADMTPLEKLQAAREAIEIEVRATVEKIEAQHRFDADVEAAKPRVAEAARQAAIEAEALKQIATEQN